MSNQDLQTYLDSLNKDIDDGSDALITLAPVVVDRATINEAEHTDEEDAKYFVDQDGNYYFHPDDESVDSGDDDLLAKASDPAAKLPPSRNSRQRRDKTPAAKVNEEDVDYVFIVDNNKPDRSAGEEEDDVDPDDPVYEFNESEATGEDDANDKDFFVATKVVTVKQDPKAVVHRCTQCTYTTQKRFLLARHMKAHSDDRPYKCSVCERGFKTNASLMNHVNTHLGNRPHACKSCEMCFTTSGELVRHVRYRHTGEKPHKCSECEYASVELSKLRRHMRCHTGERPYQCPHCTYASPDTFKLKRHMRTHTGEKPYECDICHARFTQSNSLKAHRLIHSVGDKPVFQCTLCPTTCGRKTDLRLHMQKLHHSDRPITCKRCGKDLPDRYSYKVHIKIHEGEKCYRCNICPYASISMRHLESHMFIHTDEKPYVCEQCSKAFRQQQLLNRHINLYHNSNYVPPKPREKNHSCPHCQRAFTHKGSLMRHMEVHDPLSNAYREKMKLKMGRYARVQPDGTIKNIAPSVKDYEEGNDTDDTQTDSYDNPMEMSYEVIETEEDEMDQKPMVGNDASAVEEYGTANAVDDYMPSIKNISIKKEPNGKEFMSVEVDDGQQYMLVEVIPCEEDDDDDDDENCVTIESSSARMDNSPISNANDSKCDLENCFGFEEEDDESYDDNKESIQILKIIANS